jgi:hypothetical protein
MQDPSNDTAFLLKIQQGSQVLNRILAGNSLQGHNEVQLLRSSLDLTLFNVNNHFRKRKLEEFLDDYASINSTTEVDQENDASDEIEETTEIEQSSETIEALNNLDFVIDELFKKVLKEHQVYRSISCYQSAY